MACPPSFQHLDRCVCQQPRICQGAFWDMVEAETYTQAQRGLSVQMKLSPESLHYDALGVRFVMMWRRPA